MVELYVDLHGPQHLGACIQNLPVHWNTRCNAFPNYTCTATYVHALFLLDTSLYYFPLVAGVCVCDAGWEGETCENGSSFL